MTTLPRDRATRLIEGSEVLLGFKDKKPYLVTKESALDGEDISYAATGFAAGTKVPVAMFHFNGHGTRRFAHVTEENVGKPFAIVLDDKVISAPVIREPIAGGSGQISGKFHARGGQQRRHVAACRVLAGAPSSGPRRPGRHPGGPESRPRRSHTRNQRAIAEMPDQAKICLLRHGGRRLHSSGRHSISAIRIPSRTESLTQG